MMQTPQCLTIVAALFSLPAVYATGNRNPAVTIANILKRESDIPHENVNDFLHPLFSEDGATDLVMELIFRSKKSRSRNDIDTLLQNVFVKDVAQLCTDFVFGTQIEALDLNTKNSVGETLLNRAVK